LTRPLDRHLDGDELDALVASHAAGASLTGRNSEDALREAQRHVESCHDCDRKVEMHRSAQRAISLRAMSGQAAKGPNCSEETEWASVAAGLVGESEAKERMKHASQCGYCGLMLKVAIRSLSDETTPDEEHVLAELSSARPEWRKNMAATLRDSARDRQTKTSWWRAVISWPAPAYAVAGMAVVAIVAWVAVWALHPQSAEQLLAQAYTEHRTLEVRVPGAKYAPLRVERSGAASSIDKPESLLRAEALISDGLRRNPNDPTWLQAKARADLLDGNYESALKTLQRALEVQPDSPSLLTDLASAYFERAEAADRPIDYGNAIEALGKALAKTPDDPVALFNRALICERMFLYVQAVDDWDHYLRIDPNGAWADAARRQLGAIKEKLKAHQQSLAEPLLTPAQIIAGANDDEVRHKIDSRIEEYQHEITTDWLPRAYPDSAGTLQDADTAQALRIIAHLTAEQHRDRWLKDLLARASSPNFRRAVGLLSRAVHANDEGDFASGQEFAAKSNKAFAQADNRAGALFARYEQVYALHLAQQGAPCLRVAAAFPKDFANHSYRWVQLQLQLDQGVCEWLVGDLGRARQSYDIALMIAGDAGYPAALLRAANFMAAIDSACGNESASWRQAWRGLNSYWSASVPPMQAYNLYFNLHQVGDWIHAPHLDLAVWRESVAAIDSTSDTVLRAAAHFYLGNAAFSADARDLAEAEFQQASRIFSTAPHQAPTEVTRVEAEVRLAELQFRKGETLEAYQRLASVRTEMSALANNLVALIYYRTLGEVQYGRGAFAEADSALRAAIMIAELNLRSLRGEDTRVRWAEESQAAYRTLVRLRLRQGSDNEALEIWQWYRGAPLRTTQHVVPVSLPSPAELAIGPALPELHEVASTIPTLTDQTVLSYAVFSDGIEIWAFDNSGVLAKWIAIPVSDVRRIATRFRAFCSNPASDPESIRKDARNLYDLLIAPVRDKLTYGRALAVEADDALNEVPFDVLLDENQRYFSDHTPIVTSLGVAYFRRLRPSGAISRNVSALVVAAPTTQVDEPEPLPVLSDAVDEAKSVVAQFENSVLLSGPEATPQSVLGYLPQASIFHFAGHSEMSSRGAGLLLFDRRLDATALRSADLSRLQLAVLSGCDSEGLSGVPSALDADSLARVFLHSGVPHVVASRWTVDSEATRLFMQSFYRFLLSGASASAALQESKQSLRAQPGMSHPYYWAAFHTFGRG